MKTDRPSKIIDLKSMSSTKSKSKIAHTNLTAGIVSPKHAKTGPSN